MKFIWHHNSWPWGKTVRIIKSDGSATIEMSFEDNQPVVCYISGLSVIEPQRKKGIATELMFACESFCREHNIFRIDLSSVLIDWVQNFYKKCGYVPIKEENGFMQMYKMINTKNGESK